MKLGRCSALVLSFTCCVLVFGSLVEVRAACRTQGELALALAQVLNYEKDSQDEAIKKLNNIGVGPLEDWKPTECLTEEIVIRIEESLRKAMTAGRLEGELALGAIERALTAIGALEFIPALRRSMHFLPYQEQVEPSRPVSPFRPPGDK